MQMWKEFFSTVSPEIKIKINYCCSNTSTKTILRLLLSVLCDYKHNKSKYFKAKLRNKICMQLAHMKTFYSNIVLIL